MIKLAFLLVLSVAFFGCSFSKDTSRNNTTVVKGANVHSDLSMRQKNLLAAIKLGNLALVEQELNKMELAEYSYGNSAETPMGLALKLDSLKIAQFLVGNAVDMYNLGDMQSSFEEDSLRYRNLKLMTLLDHPKIAQEMKIDFNTTQQFLSEVYLKRVKEILAHVESGDAGRFITTAGMLGVSCLYLKTQVIQSVQLGEFSDVNTAIDFIEKLLCKDKLRSSGLQVLYEAELIRQFQRLFEDPGLLGYLSRQPQLKTTMWNIDKSGILVHPNLLFRIALSEDNMFLREGLRPPCGSIEGDVDQVLCDAREKNFKEAGIKASDFELIETNDGRILRAYRSIDRYVRPMLAEADPLYFVVSFYMSGRKDLTNISIPFVQLIEVEKLGESIPWSLVIPSRPKPPIQMTDEYDEEEWYQKQAQSKREQEDREIEAEKRGNKASGASNPAED